jgi:hypothetical protein
VQTAESAKIPSALQLRTLRSFGRQVVIFVDAIVFLFSAALRSGLIQKANNFVRRLILMQASYESLALRSSCLYKKYTNHGKVVCRLLEGIVR